MSYQLILFILIHLGAFAFFLEMLRRVSHRVSEYQLKDTQRTIPFGLIRLRHIVVLYILCYAGWIVLSLFLYTTFISPDDEIQPERGNERIELEL